MTKKLHIAIACIGCGKSGSVANNALRRAVELSKYFKITIISDNFPENKIAKVVLINVKPRRFYYLRRFCHVPNEISCVNSIRHALELKHKEDPIDFVICHSHSIATIAANYLKGKYQIPYGLFTHGDIFERPPGMYDPLLTLFYKKVTPKAYKKADIVFALSPHMAFRAIQGGAGREAVKVFPNGIDTESIGIPKAIKNKNNKIDFIKILYVGMLSVEKGIDILIDACKILSKNKIHYRLRIIGKGRLEHMLKDKVSRYKISDAIEFMGYINRQNIGRHYLWANITCVPSRSDSCPNVVLESLAWGTPVIGSNVGGIPFIVKNGKNGFLAKNESPQSIAYLISYLKNNQAILNELSSNAPQSLYPTFRWQAIGQQIRDEIMKVIDKNIKLLSSLKALL